MAIGAVGSRPSKQKQNYRHALVKLRFQTNFNEFYWTTLGILQDKRHVCVHQRLTATSQPL